MKTFLPKLNLAGLFCCACLFWVSGLNAQSGNLLYGVTSYGGTDDIGVIFHFDPNYSSQTVDYEFRLNKSGRNPFSDLTEGASGKFYGMTQYGGNNDLGVIFEWDPATNTVTKKFEFDGALNGSSPLGSLTLVGSKFYGMTNAGGTYDKGVIFEWDPGTNSFTKKIEFDGSGKGSAPFGSFALYNDKLYGMTRNGGVNNYGVIFEWDPATNDFTKKIDFDGTAKGRYPRGSLTLKDGKFYGMTSNGGVSQNGVIFEWDPSTNDFTRKINFDSNNYGSGPFGSLLLNNGKFYGMTSGGGASYKGVIFEWDPSDNTFNKKIDFDGSSKGMYPYGSLMAYDGKLYGMTRQGGSDGIGTLFEWNPVDNAFVKKTDFDGPDKGGNPSGSLVLSGSKFYGMTSAGGLDGNGKIFEWDPASNTFSKTADFEVKALEGSSPNGSLVQLGTKFYGMTYSGGTSGYGVIFEWDKATSTYTKKYDFDGSSGANPNGSLVMYNEKFYGLTSKGGLNDLGVIFEWDPVLNSYTKKMDFDATTGQIPDGSMTLYNNIFYGMTSLGGTYNYGVIFQWDPATNAFTKEADFDGSDMGSLPTGSLSQLNGNLYGLTSGGGLYDMGVIFEWDPVSDIFTKKIDFDGSERGSAPRGTLVVNNGLFYGMTNSGGTTGSGVIFEWNAGSNDFNKMYELSNSTGSNPYGSLLPIDGNFYGMTNSGGESNGGVIFSWERAGNTFTKLFDFITVNGRSPANTQFVVYTLRPENQASSLVFTQISPDRFTIGWTNGNGSKRAVFVKEGTGAIDNPVDNITYTASSDWNTKGSQLGSSGYYCVFSGNGNNVVLTGLASNTQYTVQVFEFDGVVAGTELYNISTATDNPKSQTTSYLHFVTQTGAGTKNGSDWENAFEGLQVALDAAVVNDQIWVAAGTYKPQKDETGNASPAEPRTKCFKLKNGVVVYGGFQGTESSVAQRINFGPGQENETILSGDLNSNGLDANDCYHIFYHSATSGIASSAVLNGVTIMGGNSDNNGGGMLNINSSPTILNCIFSGNHAIYGGGICNDNASPYFVNCLFIDNTADEGGGVYNFNESTPIFTNCNITRNSATLGAGMSDIFSFTTIHNSIIWGNTDATAGKQIYTSEGTTYLIYSCFGNGDDDIYGTPSSTECITTDPRFIDPLNNDYRIYGTSPCVNRGYDIYNSEESDIRGEIRIQNIIDMGAYEYTFGTDPYENTITWTGAVSGEWNLADNWSPAAIPTTIDGVIIPDAFTDPVISVTENPVTNPAICNNLVIQGDAVLTISPDAALTVNHSITNNAGSGGLILQSSADGTASLLHNSAGVYAAVQRYMSNADYSDPQDGWHIISSPVIDQAISVGFTTFPDNTYDFYCWYEPSGIWVNYKNNTEEPTWTTANVIENFISNYPDNFQVGKGYMVAYDEAEVKEFAGILSIYDIYLTGLSVTSTTKSWHLLGNPYPCAIQWYNDWSLGNIAGVAQIWNEAGRSYTPVNAGEIIPSVQGFMVQVIDAEGWITIPATSRIHNATPFYKKSEYPVIKLFAHNLDHPAFQESQVRFNPVSESGYNPVYDASFLPGYAPQFYSVVSGEKLLVNSLPSFTEDITIPFSFIKTDGTNFSITAEGLGSLPYNTWLLDKKTGIDHNLTKDPIYYFSAVTGDSPERFLLHFGVVGINEQLPENFVNVWYSDNKLLLYSPDYPIKQVEITDLTGRKLFSISNIQKGTSTLYPDIAKAWYVVKLTIDEKVIVKKIFAN